MPESISTNMVYSKEAADKALARVKEEIKYCVTCHHGAIIQGEVWCCKFEKEEARACRENDHSEWEPKQLEARKKASAQKLQPDIDKKPRFKRTRWGRRHKSSLQIF